MTERIVRIGGATGGETDGILGMQQLLRAPDMDYVILDYLSEPSMGPLGRLAAEDPATGYSADFIQSHLAPFLRTLKERGIRLVSNAGGMNPRGLAQRIESLGAQMGLSIKVAAVDGDNLLQDAGHFREEGIREMFSGAPFPDRLASINAYLGAFPIAAALAKGADIVVTGRVVDSALALGPLIHEFGWKPGDHDLLAAGTVAGHLLECGAQVAGGTFTDWKDVPDWSNPGYPIGECRADGSVVITQPPGAGGLVSVGTVCEQLLYEVSDPQAYVVPDVVCDFSTVQVRQEGKDRVHVSGARGYPSTSTYKVCATYVDGWRSTCMSPIIGIDAVAKAERRNTALLALTRRILRERKLPDWRRAHAAVLGAEESFGPRALIRRNREVVASIVVEHEDRDAVEMFWREERGSQMYMTAGTASSLGSYMGAPRSVAVSKLFSFLVEKKRVPISLTFDGVTNRIEAAPGSFEPGMVDRAPNGDGAGQVCDATVPLVALAWGRSGDKGNLFNAAVIARDPAYLPFIRSALSPHAVGEWFGHLFKPGASRRVDRYEVPGIHALNFVVHESLDGGVASGSPITDRSAKGMAQQLLEFPTPVPIEIQRRTTSDNARPTP